MKQIYIPHCLKEMPLEASNKVKKQPTQIQITKMHSKSFYEFLFHF